MYRLRCTPIYGLFRTSARVIFFSLLSRLFSLTCARIPSLAPWGERGPGSFGVADKNSRRARTGYGGGDDGGLIYIASARGQTAARRIQPHA